MTGLSASGARARGDDYQHLFAWLQALGVLTGGVDEIGIEDPDAGNADDVTVRRGGKRHCYQTKYSTDHRPVADIAWIMEQSRRGGPSLMRGFYKLWSGNEENRPKISLVTNRHPAPGDLMAMADGEDDTLVRCLRRSGPGPEKARADLAGHLGIGEEELFSFLSDVRFELGRSKILLEELAKAHMHAAGLRNDDDALRRGVQVVREWVVAGSRKIGAKDVRLAAEPLRRTDLSTASLLVQMIDSDADPGSATVALDWTRLFPGSEPGARCLPSDPALWNGEFGPRLMQAARDLRSAGGTHVLVRGYMRLPTWFMAGAALRKTAGFEVSSVQGGRAWSSEGDPACVRIERDVIGSSGADLAVGIALAYDPSEDVSAYLRRRQIDARYARIRPAGGPGNYSISGSAEAKGWALAARDCVRRLVGENQPNCIRLFLAGPHAAMLLLGHFWDRMPRTQLYEYLGAGKGYAPSYTILG